MKLVLIVVAAGLLVTTLLLLGQSQRTQADGTLQPVARTQFEVVALYPRETQPGVYQQVEQRQIDALSSQGWELVSTMPYIYRNEEHDNGAMHGPKPVVTQTYPAFFFKRVKLQR
jgi:hypothetical protein